MATNITDAILAALKAARALAADPRNQALHLAYRDALAKLTTEQLHEFNLRNLRGEDPR